MVRMLEAIPLVLLVYLAIGVVVGLCFVLRGVNRLDSAAVDSPFVFRLMILPGCIGLWPVVAVEVVGCTERGGAMTSGQRKAHIVMWLVLGPIAVVGLALALMNRLDVPVHNGELPGVESELKPLIDEPGSSREAELQGVLP